MCFASQLRGDSCCFFRASCFSTYLVSTPLQRNFAPAFINSERAFSPSWLMTVMFLRTTTNVRPSISSLAVFHAVLNSPIQGAISLPSRTNRRSVRLSITEIFSMLFLFAHHERAIRIPNLDPVMSWIPRLRLTGRCCRVETDESALNRPTIAGWWSWGWNVAPGLRSHESLNIRNERRVHSREGLHYVPFKQKVN